MRIIALALGISLTLAAFPARADDTLPTLKAPPLMVGLRQVVLVDDAYVRLGDVFDGAGEYADRQILQAPAPGKRLTLDSTWLYKLARSYGLEWRPLGKNDRAVVERSSTTIDSEEIHAAIKSALAAKGVSQDADVSISQRELRMHIPANGDPTVTIEDVVFERTSQRFSCVAVVAAGTSDASRLRISGQVYTTTEIPVLAHATNKGEVLTAGDIQWKQVRSSEVGSDTMTDIDHIIGMTPVRFLREGTSVRLSDVQKPVLVAKGALVTMMIKTPTMSLSVQGRALEDGVKGASIQVANTLSKRSVLATVVSADAVVVRTAASVAALN